jgi:hypothetical protein
MKDFILVSPNKVENMVFVHSASDVESDTVFRWQGISNFYLLWYRSEDEKLVLQNYYLMYPCLHNKFSSYSDQFRKEVSRRIGQWGICEGKNTSIMDK